MTQDVQNYSKFIEFCSKYVLKLMLSKLPKSKTTLYNLGPEANREKTAMEPKHIDFGSHLGAILASSWGTWEAFGAFWASWGQLEPT